MVLCFYDTSRLELFYLMGTDTSKDWAGLFVWYCLSLCFNKEARPAMVDHATWLMKQLEMLGCVSNLAGSACPII